LLSVVYEILTIYLKIQVNSGRKNNNRIRERKSNNVSNLHSKRNRRNEFQTDTHILFVDFKQLYDKILLIQLSGTLGESAILRN